MARKKAVLVDYKRLELEVWRLTEALVLSCGAELIDVQFEREAGEWYLRLFIDREAPPVDHNLCEQVSNLVSAALDETDPIEQAYYLEISSPGLERPLRRAADFTRFAGQRIAVRLYAPRAGVKQFDGILLGLRDNALLLQVKEQELAFPLEDVAQAHLVAEF